MEGSDVTELDSAVRSTGKAIFSPPEDDDDDPEHATPFDVEPTPLLLLLTQPLPLLRKLTLEFAGRSFRPDIGDGLAEWSRWLWRWPGPGQPLGRVRLCSLNESSFLTACGLAAPMVENNCWKLILILIKFNYNFNIPYFSFEKWSN